MPYPQKSSAKAPKHAEPGVALGVSPSPSFPQIEERVLDYWKSDETFRESIRQREGAEEWVFNDGPPFANGVPH